MKGLHERLVGFWGGLAADTALHRLASPLRGRTRVDRQVLLSSDGEDLSTAALVRGLGHALGRPARLVPVPVSFLKRAGQVFGRAEEIERLTDSLQLDIGPTRERLDWNPPFSVEEGLQRTAEAYHAARSRG